MACTSSDDSRPDYDSRTKPLSAVAAFSNLVCSHQKLTSDIMLTRGVARRLPEWCSTGPHSLPTEILRMIFQCVFGSCVSLQAGDDDLALWLDEDPLSPSLFPYSLSCVCLRWFRILKTIPVYWTRLVIPLDAIAASLTTARIVFQWAGSRPLKVIVMRHRGIVQSHDWERAGVGRAMRFLYPHIRHIWSLSFDVEHSSSIPALWQESGQARHLKMLTLLSRSDVSYIFPSSRGLPPGNSHEYEGKLDVPELEQVTFSGHFFKNSLMAHPRFASWFRHVTSLTICGDASSGRCSVSLYKFLSVIDMFSSVQQLTIEDIHFDDNAPYPNLLTLRPISLCLRRITGKTALQGILTRPRLEGSRRTDISIIECDIHGFRDPDPGSSPQFSSTSLTLASMNPATAIDDLVCRWNGERLTVIGCPRVSRSFLVRLHGETAPMRLCHLNIVDCDNFNARDVISLVQSRETQAGFVSLMGVSDDDSFTALAEVRVEGRGPPISVKRARWLADHVEMFVWDTVAKDGLRYVWDGSVEKLMVLPASGGAKRLPYGVTANATAVP